MSEREAVLELREYAKNSWGDLNESFELAIKALEKQIPKKPEIWGDGYADGQLVYDSYDCPNCGKTYELDYDDYDYCPKCGQKFDWSEVE